MLLECGTVLSAPARTHATRTLALLSRGGGYCPITRLLLAAVVATASLARQADGHLTAAEVPKSVRESLDFDVVV